MADWLKRTGNLTENTMGDTYDGSGASGGYDFMERIEQGKIDAEIQNKLVESKSPKGTSLSGLGSGYDKIPYIIIAVILAIWFLIYLKKQ